MMPIPRHPSLRPHKVRLLLALAAMLGALPARAQTSAAVADTLVGVSPESIARHVNGPPRWALVLSGGAARGFAHIGVLRALEEEGLRPDLIVGTSMGGLIGALYASGQSSGEITTVVREMDWAAVFDPHVLAPEWRRTISARPWIKLVKGGKGLGLPGGLYDDSNINFQIAAHLLDGESIAQGDFDRLPIPLRLVATDVASLEPVVLRSGNLGRAVRTSISIPAAFPPIAEGDRLLVDGGIASNLPVSIARAAGARQILAIDVAMPEPKLDEGTSALAVSLALLDRVNRRGQVDTVGSADLRVWLKMPKFSPTAWSAVDSLIEQGYRGALPVIHAWAEREGLPRRSPPAVRPPLLLPPLSPDVLWFDRHGNPARRAESARAVLGRLPSGRFPPGALHPALERVYRANLFDSSWPWISTAGETTSLGMQVREYAPTELRAAFGFHNDDGARAQAALLARPYGGPYPARLMAQGTWRKYGWEANGAIEPHPLDRGSAGWFVRGGFRHSAVRIFDSDGLSGTRSVDRTELAVGVQNMLPSSDVVQAGIGSAFVTSDRGDQAGALLALRSESSGSSHRLVDGVWMPGGQGYGALFGTLEQIIPFTREWSLRPGLRGFLSSSRTPLDELRGLGGPSSLAGLRQEEWLGQSMIAGEVRLARQASAMLLWRGYAQSGYVEHAVSRSDLGPHALVSGGLGVTFSSPLGPITLDWGIANRSSGRIDLQVGQRF